MGEAGEEGGVREALLEEGEVGGAAPKVELEDVAACGGHKSGSK